jgi:hypothetical protein
MAAMTAATSPPAGLPKTRDPDSFHPLEIIPFFRRWKCGPVRDLLYTLVWNCGIGVAFWAIGAMFRPRGLQLEHLVTSVIVANGIGYTLHAMFLVTGRLGIDRWARGFGQAATAVYYTAMSTLGVVVGFSVVALAFDPGALRWILTPRWLAMMGLSSMVISTVLAIVFFSTVRRATAEAELARERERIERAEREAVLANLRALQAQIEPHFLFNTLANVASLVDSDPAAAKRMLESFNRFLRASLAATRTESTTLGADAELVAAYLGCSRCAWASACRGASRCRRSSPPTPCPRCSCSPWSRMPSGTGSSPRSRAARWWCVPRATAGRSASRSPTPGWDSRRRPAAAWAWRTCATGCGCCMGRAPSSPSARTGRRGRS